MKLVPVAFLLVFIISIIASAQTVCITKSGSKYHLSNCSYLSKSNNLIIKYILYMEYKNKNEYRL